MYTTTIKVRNVLPTLLINTDILGKLTSDTWHLLTYPAIDCPTILKNSTTLVEGTDFDFVQPDEITLGLAADNEHFIATVYMGITDTNIETLIGRADRYLDSVLYNYNPSTGLLDDWSSILSASYYLLQYCSATEENTEKIKDLQKLVEDQIDTFKNNVTDKDFCVIKVN